jgi:hypothetical protein
MRTNRNSCMRAITTYALLFAWLFCAACDINVKKEQNGKDKQVDINTLVGGIHVSQQADATDVGLSVYPGARIKEQDDKDGTDKSANVNISGFGFGIRVVALEYESDDSPAKILSFYKDQLKKYGSVLECHTSGHSDVHANLDSHDSKDDSDELTCESDHGDNVELKVGKKHDQHIVEVEPEGKGSRFSLVYVRTHGKDADI